MSSGTRPPTHDACPGDEVLLAHLDHVLGDDERASVEIHLASCPACDRRMRVLADRSRRLGTWLERHDPELPRREAYDLTPPRPVDRGLRRWALAASMVVAVGVAAGPARGWLLHRLGPREAPPTSVEVRPADGATTGTSFVPRGSEVVVVFDAGVEGRRLVVVAGSDDSVATLLSPTSDAAVVLRPDRIEVHDAGTAGGEYRLSVPRGVVRVRLRVAGVDEVVIPTGDAAPARQVVDISPGDG